jgi:spermidine synthase
MGKISDLLIGIQTLEEVESSVNGEIKIVKGIAFGTYIQVEGLTQSGGILKSVWRKPLKKVKNQNIKVKRCLILGLGGGTVAGLVRHYWGNDVEITGVDLDPVMVNLGKKYLDLDKHDVNVVVGDAFDFVENSKFQIPNSKFDLILVDLYIGREYPKKFESDEFIKAVKKALYRNGMAIFNRLYFDEKRAQAVKFGKKLEKIFNKVDVVYPEANIMFLCS